MNKRSFITKAKGHTPVTHYKNHPRKPKKTHKCCRTSNCNSIAQVFLYFSYIFNLNNLCHEGFCNMHSFKAPSILEHGIDLKDTSINRSDFITIQRVISGLPYAIYYTTHGCSSHLQHNILLVSGRTKAINPPLQINILHAQANAGHHLT